ncbi:MAG TPA: hypothetical protein VJ808_14065 [Gemmatimonadales bacterium]|nr:hypothetical protein [Gemmatimonadales bacterium]
MALAGGGGGDGYIGAVRGSVADGVVEAGLAAVEALEGSAAAAALAAAVLEDVSDA